MSAVARIPPMQTTVYSEDNTVGLSSARLTSVFLAALHLRTEVRVADLEAVLVRLVDRAQIAWPELGVEGEPLIAHLAAGLAGSDIDDATLAATRIDDLALAFACGCGNPAAVAAFELRYAGDLRVILARFRAGPELIDEVRQRVRQRLFVAESDQRPAICRYTGRGELLAFLRVTAVRIALDLLRARGARNETTDEGLAELPAEDNPELRYLKLLYRREFKAAFEAALAELPARARTLVRYEVVDRLSIDKIAAIYELHRSTVARQIHQTRRALVEGTRRELARRLALQPTELDSIMRLIEGDVDLSVERVLARG